MDLTLTDDQRLVQTTAREFLSTRRSGADAAAMAGEPVGYSTALWKEMVELGWPGLPFGEAYGGAGSGFLELCLLIEELGRAQVPSPLVSSVACCGMPIARFGTEQQRSQWLGGIARGRIVSYVRAAQDGGWSSAGSDVVAHRTTAGFELDGTALFVPYAQAADDLLVVAQHGEPPELIVLLVDATSPGITREPLEVVDIHPLCRVDFERVTVPAGAVLGDPGAGRQVVEATAGFGTAATCAEMVGGAQAVLEMTVEYATQRRQFGKPIGTFQAVQHRCADMAIDVLSSRLIAYEAIWRLAEHGHALQEVSLAKAWVSEAYQRVCESGHQVHGAIGFTAEHRLHHYLRHAIASATAFGDSDFHTERLGRDLGL